VKLAVYVAALDGAVTVWLAAPLSDQLPNTYCVPVAPACVAAAIVWLVPGVHWNEHGAVHAAASTVRLSPAGLLVTVMLTGDAVKFAVTLKGPFIVTFCGVAVPVSAPLNPENVYPEAALALTETTAPALYHPVAGLIVPPADGFALVVSWYCVVKLAVYVAALDGAVTVWLAAPLSDQLPNTYCVPVVPACVAPAIVWLDPGVHWNEHGAVHAAASTVRLSPTGVLVTVMLTGDAVKFAVTLKGPFIVTFCGVAVPVRAPLKPENL
jgi:uncharacterized SAM-binding protein YcdF (DUF218 family)